jgi:microcystin-dependent protein
MAGTIPLSMTQQFDPLGNPLSGGKLYGIVAGTVSTPQNYFQDLALTLPWPNPITLDVAGRVPQLFIADGLLKVRLTDSAGVVMLSADNIQVIGASSGGGGGGAIDATTIAQTGDIKPRYGVGTHTGWVRCNFKTIGSAISGATERANADTQPLFIYLYGADPNLVVTGGRTGNALNDFNANKQITLPDGRGVTFAGLDDMGNTAAGRLSTYFGAGTVLGTIGGSPSNTLTASQLAIHAHGASIYDLGHGHNFIQDGAGTTNISYVSPAVVTPGNATTSGNAALPAHSTSIQGAGTGVRVWDGVTLDQTWAAGSNQPHANVQPTMVVTIYIKL